MRHRRFLLMLLARSPVPFSSRRCSAAAGSSSSSSSVSASAATTAAAAAATPIPSTALASRFAALRLYSSSALPRGGPRAPPGRRCTALPLARALLSSRKVEEAGSARFSTKRRMTNPASAAATPPAPAPATAAAANAVDPSSPGADPAAQVPSSSSKREREERGAAGAGGGDNGGNGGMQQQQQQNNNASADDARGPSGESGGGGKRRRGSKKPATPEALLRKEVHQSARNQDARAALAAFDSYLELLRGENEKARDRASAAAAAAAEAAAAAGEEKSDPPPYYHSPLWDPATSLVHVSSDVRNSLLYLCAGGDAWDAELAGPEARARRRAASGSAAVAAAAPAPAAAASAPSSSSSSPLSAGELARRGRELFDRTTNCLADVERPLIGCAAAAAAPSAAAADGNGPASTAAQQQQQQQQQQQLSGDGEMAYTALARMAARAGDPRGSLAAAREAVARGFPPRLRCFSPALLAFSVEGDAASAFAVEREAREEHGLEMTEPELGFLASAAAAANSGSSEGKGEGGEGGGGGGDGEGGAPSSAAPRGVPFEFVDAAVLAVLTREHGRLQRETIAALEAYFASLGPDKWRVGRARVEPGTGRVKVPKWSLLRPPSSPSASPASPPPSTKPDFFAPDALGPVDLEPHEWAAFSEGVAALARARERSPAGAFDAFCDWCAANGPFDAVVDGANVALFGQNWSHGDFSFAQLEAVVEELKARLGPGSRTLVVLHRSRLAAPPARDAAGRRVLRSLASEAVGPSSSPPSEAPSRPLPAQALLYAAPHGSNDDWYWLHAAVAAGARGLVVSNDEMRDHVFQLLSPRFAARWKDRHQARYSFRGNYHSLGSSSSAALYGGNGSGNGGSGNGNGSNGSGSGVSAKLLLPPPFSECSQRLPKTGAWLFPRAVVVAAPSAGGGKAAEQGREESGEGEGEGEDGDPDEWLCCSPVA